MKNWSIDEVVNILGPLGNFWTEYDQYEPILIGGGVGIAPIINLKNSINKENYTFDGVYFGNVQKIGDF